MKNDDLAMAYIVQAICVKVLQAVCIIGGLIGAIWHGLESAILGVIAAWFFGMAKPPPNETLDRESNRKD